MTPHKQLIRHCPEEGRFGDCYRTAIACLLDHQPETVPHFYDGLFEGSVPGAVKRQVRAWLAAHGLVEVNVAIECELREALLYFGEAYPGLYLMFSGRSRTGCNHVVIVRDGAIVHDPHPDDVGIVGPCDDGHFHVALLARPL